jgi:hypothetical protein
MLAMNGEPHQPAGFCPKCGYAIDAGRCPECGTIVSPERLARSPRAYRRWRRTVIIVLSLLAIATAGYYGYRAVDWLALAPTSALLAFQSANTDGIAAELIRRYKASNLSTQQAQEMFEAMVGTPSLDVRSSAPANTPFLGWFRPDLAIPDGSAAHGWHVFLDSWAFAVDGRAIEHCPSAGAIAPIDRASGFSLPIPGMEPGSHEIASTWVFALASGNQLNRNSAKILHTWRVTASATVVVAAESAEQFVQAISSRSTIAAMRTALHIPSTRQLFQGQRGTIAYYCDRLPVAVAGELWVRPSGPGPYERARPFHAGSGTHASWIDVSRVSGVRNASHVDIRIVPSAGLAFELDEDRYFGCVIEVDHVPVQQQVGPWDPRLAEEASEIRIVPVDCATTRPADSAPATPDAGR